MGKYKENSRYAARLPTQKNSGKQDLYRLPDRLPIQSSLLYLGQGSGICLGLSWLFYRSLLPGICVLPLFSRRYLKRKRSIFLGKRQRTLREDFRDLAEMLTSFLLAGYSVENAMQKACRQMEAAKGTQRDVTEMLSCMLREISMGENAEQVWLHFSEQMPVEEIRDFGQIFSLSKRSGASLPEVLRCVVRQLDQKIQTEDQIETIIAGKKAEQKVMNLMPAAILLYICVTSADMMQIMYTTWTGRIIMTVCLAVYLWAFRLSEQITASL